jgi:nucleotide-binding universal stress UspA family protein
MLRLRHILFPTDFSEVSRSALDHALLWSDLGEADLHLLHVLSLRTADPFNPEHHFPEAEELYERLSGLARSEMAALLEPHRDRMLRIRESIERAPEVERGILDAATADDADLIVMGTHGRRGPAHLFLGSVVSEVLRRAERPVLVVPGRDGRKAGKLSKILAPVDFSPISKRAAADAAAIAQATGAALELFHVVPDLEVPLPMNPAGLGAASMVVTELVPAAREALSTLAAALQVEGSAAIEVWHGAPAPTILNRAAETGADLVVIGTAGHTGLDRLLLGSVAARIARLAPCPVLVVPGRGRALSGA